MGVIALTQKYAIRRGCKPIADWLLTVEVFNVIRRPLQCAFGRFGQTLPGCLNFFRRDAQLPQFQGWAVELPLNAKQSSIALAPHRLTNLTHCRLDLWVSPQRASRIRFAQRGVGGAVTFNKFHIGSRLSVVGRSVVCKGRYEPTLITRCTH